MHSKSLVRMAGPRLELPKMHLEVDQTVKKGVIIHNLGCKFGRRLYFLQCVLQQLILPRLFNVHIQFMGYSYKLHRGGAFIFLHCILICKSRK